MKFFSSILEWIFGREPDRLEPMPAPDREDGDPLATTDPLTGQTLGATTLVSRSAKVVPDIQPEPEPLKGIRHTDAGWTPPPADLRDGWPVSDEIIHVPDAPVAGPVIPIIESPASSPINLKPARKRKANPKKKAPSRKPKRS